MSKHAPHPCLPTPFRVFVVVFTCELNFLKLAARHRASGEVEEDFELREAKRAQDPHTEFVSFRRTRLGFTRTPPRETFAVMILAHGPSGNATIHASSSEWVVFVLHGEP